MGRLREAANATGGASEIGAQPVRRHWSREGAKVVITDPDGPSDASGRQWLDHYYVVGGGPPRVGRAGGLLRHERGRALVRKSGRDGVRGGRRWHLHQHG